MSLQFLADYSSASGHSAPIWSIATSSKVLWSASADGLIKAWDISSGRSIGVAMVSPHRNAVTSLSISEQRGILVSGSMDGSLALWKLEPFHEKQEGLPEVEGMLAVHTATTEEEGGVEQPVDQSQAQSSTAVNASQETELHPSSYCPSVARATFEEAEGKLATFPIDAYVSDLHPTEPILATTGNTATVSLYRIDPDASSGSSFLSPLRRFRADNVIRPSRQAPASSSSVMRTNGLDGNRGAKKGWGMCIRFSPLDGRLVAVGTDSGQVIVHSTRKGDVVASFSNHAAAIRNITFGLSPVGGTFGAGSLTSQNGGINSTLEQGARGTLDHLVVSSDDRTLTIHDARDLEQHGREASDTVVAMLQGHAGRVLDASLRADGRIVASVSSDKTIKLWDLLASPKSCVCTIGEDEKMWVLKWISSSQFVAAGDQGIVKWYRGAGVASNAGEDL